MTVFDAVRLGYNRAGLAILPTKADGSKAPDVSNWGRFKTARPTAADIRTWGVETWVGFGVIGGAVSGHVDPWDFDDRATFDAFVDAADACGLGDVVSRIRTGYEVETPSGGRRWLVRYPPDLSFQDVVLARRSGRDGEPPVKTLIEVTLFSIVAPSNGRTHPSGRPYVQLSGNFATIATVTADERAALFALARTFDQLPRPAARAAPVTTAATGASGDRPGDSYNRRMTWPQILEPAGWTHVGTHGEVSYWCRPGKQHSVSATTNIGGSDLFYPFTSSTVFEADKSYDKFGAYVVLHHHGDFSRAAQALSRDGYGTQDDVIITAPPSTPVRACTLADVEATFTRWIRDDDPIPTRVVLATYVAHRHLDGDPVWMMVVGGSGVGKTERLIPLAAMPDVVLESSITGPAALLSGTGKKERAKDATGGLLRKFPNGCGVLLLKDFTSILDMHRDARAEVLAALREIYDGRWDRSVGVDGGKTLTWIGRLGLMAGCTTAIDSAHSVTSVMGTRFLFVRLYGDQDIAGSAFDHVGDESPMRADLHAAVRGLLDHLPGTPYDKTEVRAPMIALASYVARARSPVDRDQRSDIRLVLDPEAPTRIVKMLTQLWRAAGLLGLDKASAWALVRRVGMDSIPKLRRVSLDYLATCLMPATTTDVAEAVEHPTTTTRRTLEDLAAHRVVTRLPSGSGKADRWELSAQTQHWLDQTVPVLSEPLNSAGVTVPVLSGSIESTSPPATLSYSLINPNTVLEDKTGKVGSEPEPLPAWVTEAAEPDLSDPIGAHDE